MMDTLSLPPWLEGTYRLERGLGSGGCACIYKAWHERLGKYVVVKDVADADIGADDMIMRRNEVEALKNVKNAYLPQVFDYLARGGHSYTVMEYIEGESFDKLLRRGKRFTQPQVVRWYGQLASALSAIHRQSIFHRDIKPANVMLAVGGDVCLIDFNSALVGELGTKLVSRSLGYASPEQYDAFRRLELLRAGSSGLNRRSDGAISVSEKTQFFSCGQVTLMRNVTAYRIDWRRSDIYSLGATMYHILTGRHPIKRAQGVAALPELGWFNSGIARIIERSMQYDPMLRYGSAEELASAIAELR